MENFDDICRIQTRLTQKGLKAFDYRLLRTVRRGRDFEEGRFPVIRYENEVCEGATYVNADTDTWHSGELQIDMLHILHLASISARAILDCQQFSLRPF